MNDIFIFISIIAIIFGLIAVGGAIFSINSKIKTLTRTLSHQYALMVKMQSVLKSRHATNIVAENAEMIYQDLLQNLIPIMAAVDIMPRSTAEHPLWRALGGIMDEYAKNPFALEKLRRAIKLDGEVARSVDNYLNRAEGFLGHLTATEPNGILSATFTDGLLGQSLAFFSQAKQLAEAE
ncbi:MAG: hypothetical protein LBF28_02440 [Rickettsiales bacterium]|jgi:hypothetical protein|nr:hypothetical protein [Rickettsiales bacterium]